MYRSGRSNSKADALTRIPNSVPADNQDEHRKYQHRALLSPECFEKYSESTNTRFSRDREVKGGGSGSGITSDEQINALTDQDLPLYARVTLVNKEDDDCGRIRNTLEKDPSRTFETINLNHYSSYNNALFYKDRL